MICDRLCQNRMYPVTNPLHILSNPVDFFIAPLMWNIGMAMESDEIKMNTSRWMPLTLQAGAMFHLSFGAILGATAWRKKDEVEVHHRNGGSSSP